MRPPPSLVTHIDGPRFTRRGQVTDETHEPLDPRSHDASWPVNVIGSGSRDGRCAQGRVSRQPRHPWLLSPRSGIDCSVSPPPGTFLRAALRRCCASSSPAAGSPGPWCRGGEQRCGLLPRRTARRDHPPVGRGAGLPDPRRAAAASAHRRDGVRWGRGSRTGVGAVLDAARPHRAPCSTTRGCAVTPARSPLDR